MKQQKMIVLGLIAIGKRYGFEMEAFVHENELRQWAQIGASTIYKTLNDLSKEGLIAGIAEKSEKGPARKSYSLTDAGRDRLHQLVGQALGSDESVYSTRIAGLVFAPLLGTADARAAVGRSITGLKKADSGLEKSLANKRGDVIAEAVIEYYRDVYAAEMAAMEKVLQSLGG